MGESDPEGELCAGSRNRAVSGFAAGGPGLLSEKYSRFISTPAGERGDEGLPNRGLACWVCRQRAIGVSAQPRSPETGGLVLELTVRLPPPPLTQRASGS